MASIENKEVSLIARGSQFAPSDRFSLAANTVFDNYSKILEYATSSGTAYAGAIVGALKDEVIGDVTYKKGAYFIASWGEGAEVIKVGTDTDLSGIEQRLGNLESISTKQVSTSQELLDTQNPAGRILYLTTQVEGYEIGAYICLGGGNVQKIGTSSAGGETPEEQIVLLEQRITAIENQIKNSGIYKFKGSVSASGIESIEPKEVGDVWNVTEDFTINDDSTKVYPKGTNIAWTGEQWDALAGIYDLSKYELPKGSSDKPNIIWSSENEKWETGRILPDTTGNVDKVLKVSETGTLIWSSINTGDTNIIESINIKYNDTQEAQQLEVTGKSVTIDISSKQDVIGVGSAETPHIIWDSENNKWTPGKIEIPITPEKRLLPQYTAENSGQILTVSSEGTVIWSSPSPTGATLEKDTVEEDQLQTYTISQEQDQERVSVSVYSKESIDDMFAWKELL